MPPPRSRTPWLALAAVLLLILAGMGLLIWQQWQQDSHRAQLAAQRELELLASLVRVNLQQGDYQAAAQILQRWGEQEEISALRLLAGNGFAIAEYRRPAPARRSLALERSIPYSYRGEARLYLVKDLAPIERHRDTLLLQFGTAFLILAGLLAALTRALLLYRREAAELAARGAELDRANSELSEALMRRQEAEVARERLSSILEATTDMVGMADPQGRVLYINRAGRHILGLGERPVADLDIRQLHPPWATEKILGEGIPAAIRDGAWGGETALLGADGREIPVSQVILSHRDGEGRLQHLSTVIRDIRAQKQAEAALRASEAQLEEAQAIAHLGSWDLDLATGKANWSREEYRLLGYAPGAVEAGVEAFLARVHPDDLERVRTEMQAAMGREHGEYRVEHRVALPDGAERIVLEQGRVHFDDAGRPLRMVGSTLDVTELRQAERELEAHRHHLEELVAVRTRQVREQAAIIDQIHDAVVSTDLEGVITGWNRGAERLYGYPAGEAIGRDVGMLYFDRAVLQRDVIQPLRAKGALEVELTLKRKDGSAVGVLLSLSLRRNEQGEPVGMIGYSLDIGARKEAQRLLQQRSDELAAANRELESFAYSVSHDLRAPLRAIDGFSLALLEDCAGQLDAVAMGHLQRIRAASQKMGRLIDDLLRLSRVTRAALRPEQLNLSAMAREVLAQLRDAQPGRKVRIAVEDGLLALGDAGLMRVALENLLGNAWKYTAKTADARIEFGRLWQDGQTVYFVRDNGAGFDMRYADKLFGAFQRLHHPSEFEGTGVGLATVQRILQRHGGRIWAEAEPGRGACFYFTLGGSGQPPADALRE